MPVNKIRTAVLLVVTYAASSGLAAPARVHAQAGLPATDREWFGDDYLRAAEMITTGKTSLPRLSDKKGVPLLERLTSTDHFAFYRNKSLPPASRMEDLMKSQQSVNAIMKQYAVAANKKGGEDLHDELIRLMAFSLRTNVLMVDLVDEFLPTIP